MRRLKPYEGHVYFLISPGMELVKIGFTSGDIGKRIRALQTGCPFALRLFGAFPGSQDEERRLHKVFAAMRVHGEWFSCIGALEWFVRYFETSDPNDRQMFEASLHDNVLYAALMPGEKPGPPIDISPFAADLAEYERIYAAEAA